MIRSRALPLALRRSLLALSPLAATAALAAPGPTAAAEGDVGLDAVKVTGSRLARGTPEGATPLWVIDREAIDASGDFSVADLLRDLPLATTGNFRPQSGSTAQSLATVDLRGLGPNRTLVLVDGRRAPTNPMSASFGADLNAIPLSAVERIEILADGASAIYGADAIGGVVNIILRRDFEGAQLRYGRGWSEAEGGDTEEMSMLMGGGSERTRLVAGASASRRGIVFTRDQIGGAVRGVGLYGNNYYDWSTGSARAVPGFDCSQGAFYVQDNGLCGFDFNQVAANEAKLSRVGLDVRADHQINDRWNLYSSASLTRVESFGRYAPTPGLLVVDDGSPNDVDPTDGLPTYFFHRFAAAGNRDEFTEASNLDFVLGFQGQLTDRVQIDVGLRRADYRFVSLGRGYIVSDIANEAANSGRYDLSDPYGADPSLLSSLQATLSTDARWRSDEIHATAEVDLFDLGGGRSRAVFGAEHRRGTYYSRFDSLSEAGAILGTAGNSSGGDRDVDAVFFEWLLPFVSSFDLSLAGRYDDYSDYGQEFSPRVALRWQPLDPLTFRASWGQGFVAPGLDILTQAPTFSAEPISDPATCLALGAPSNCQTQVDTVTLANPDLGSERAEHASLGLSYDATAWMSLGVDYHRVRVDDRISKFTPQEVVVFAANPGLYGPLPAGLGVDRGPDGRIQRITSGYVNRGRVETDGVDLRIGLDFGLGDWGALDSQLAVSHVLDYTIDSGLGRFDLLGRPGYPDLRAALSNTWRLGDVSVTWNVNHIGDHGGDSGSARIGSYATHDLQLTWRAPWDGRITLGATNLGDRHPAQVPYDGRPYNFYLYDGYGRTTYLRYTQAF
ncbi:TonB-dependent receptor plug domain-containing protein [Arenimonas sp. MALMAid1274]|uniref:TonB-dependent receptor plug domain-containing protein n=1 Tax=Arenimonas sp. MALMAid1274 TaxID=3411630 RepID=UPI003BA1F1DC